MQRGTLILMAGPQTGQRYSLRPGRNVIGRDETCEIALVDETTSRRHCAVELDGHGAATLLDLGSVNGTRLNGRRVERAELCEGDQIAIGQTVLVYRVRERETVVVQGEGALVAVSRLSLAKGGAAEARAGEAPERHLRRMQSVCRLAREIGDHDHVADLCRAAGAAIARDVDVDRAAIVLEDGQAWAFDGRGARLEEPFAPSRALLAAAHRARDALLFAADRDADWARRASVARARVTSAIAIPLQARDRPFGWVYLDRRERADLDLDDLALARDLALQVAPAAARLLELARGRADPAEPPPILAIDPASLAALDALERAAGSDASVLLLGETGTGKELYARELHRRSRRAAGPWVTLNMAALPGSLVESELFGHVAGAFTGAVAARPGVFVQAHGGTLLLDEVGELPLELAAKLLRAIETGEVRPVGATEVVKVDVRYVAATHRDLAHEVAEGRFREDLYYRLAVCEIRIPPLRQRPADVLPLLGLHLARCAARLGREPPRILPDAAEALLRHAWPGNARELRNLAERLLVLAPAQAIGRDDLPASITGAAALVPDLPVMTLKEAEAWAIRRALAHTGGRKGEAAKLLGTSWPTLNRKIKEFGLEVPAGDADPAADGEAS